MEGKHIKLIDVMATSIVRWVGNLPAFHFDMCDCSVSGVAVVYIVL